MELFGGDSKGLYMLNSELKARVYTAPSMTMEWRRPPIRQSNQS